MEEDLEDINELAHEVIEALKEVQQFKRDLLEMTPEELLEATSEWSQATDSLPSVEDTTADDLLEALREDRRVISATFMDGIIHVKTVVGDMDFKWPR